MLLNKYTRNVYLREITLKNLITFWLLFLLCPFLLHSFISTCWYLLCKENESMLFFWFKLLICNFIDTECFLFPHSLSKMKHLLSSKTEAKFSYHWISYGFPIHLSQHRTADEKWGCLFSLPHCYTQGTGSMFYNCKWTLHIPLPCPQCDSSARAIYHIHKVFILHIHVWPLLWKYYYNGLAFMGWMQWSFGKQSYLTYG